MEIEITHQKIRAVLKKANLEVGHIYHGKIVDRFSGGLEVINYWNDGVRVSYSPTTFSRQDERDERDEREAMKKAREVLEKLYVIKFENNEILILNKEQ